MAKPTRRPHNPTLETRLRDVWHNAPQSVRRRVWGVIGQDQRNALEALEMQPGAKTGDIARWLGVDFGDARYMLERALMQTCLELQAQYRAENPRCILSNQTVGLLDGEHALAWRTLK